MLKSEYWLLQLISLEFADCLEIPKTRGSYNPRTSEPRHNSKLRDQLYSNDVQTIPTPEVPGSQKAQEL